MKKLWLISLIVCIAITANAQDQEWKTIETFEGSGISNTAPFTVNSEEWKIEYSSTASNPVLKGNGHILQVYLLKPGQETFEGEIVANEVNKENISGESFIYQSGRFYLKSNSANGDWEIKVMVSE
ncbi:hypothetical protein [Fodinibius salsisoli]|uniref:Uncharacterized protein n=1 Tax=Fodinibius salsisoli TaxID=2820877 RepID=A0ABT3PQF8_9BACT|nr:hypothetical protein [Fodinibius salsisoli]MCW9708097.1 hypothetical protein [Fodinibius salsisoli]